MVSPSQGEANVARVTGARHASAASCARKQIFVLALPEAHGTGRQDTGARGGGGDPERGPPVSSPANTARQRRRNLKPDKVQHAGRGCARGGRLGGRHGVVAEMRAAAARRARACAGAPGAANASLPLSAGDALRCERTRLWQPRLRKQQPRQQPSPQVRQGRRRGRARRRGFGRGGRRQRRR